MVVSKEYDIFQNKLKDLKSSLSLIDNSLKLSESSCFKYSLKDINLARSILVRNMHIATYELFIQYTNTRIRNFVNDIFIGENKDKIFQFLRAKKKVISQISIGFGDLELLVNTPLAKIEAKVISCFQNKEKNEKYINSLENLMNMKLKQELKENILLSMSMRHIFVHNNGKVSVEWKKKYSKSLHRNKFKLKKKRNEMLLPTDYIHLKMVLESYSAFCEILEQCIIKTPTEAGV